MALGAWLASRGRRRGIFYSALPLAVLLAAVAVARADVPNVFSDGDALSAQRMNKNFQDLDTRLKLLEAKTATIEALTNEVDALQGDIDLVNADNQELKEKLGEDPSCPLHYTLDKDQAGFTLCTYSNDQMVKVGTGAVAFWIDRFEATLWNNTDGVGTPYNSIPTIALPSGFTVGGEGTAPYALSVTQVAPSNLVSWFQAQAACAASGKRLPSTAEWYQAARETPQTGTGCLVSGESTRRKTGLGDKCRSKWGAEDMIGNLWEWTLDWHFSVGLINPTTDSGDPISLLDITSQSNTPWTSNAAQDEAIWHGDRIWGIVSQSASSESRTPNGTLLGGSFQNNASAGLFAIAADRSVAAQDPLVGFRCVIARTSL